MSILDSDIAYTTIWSRVVMSIWNSDIRWTFMLTIPGLLAVVSTELVSFFVGRHVPYIASSTCPTTLSGA
jgi:hypothetical protein